MGTSAWARSTLDSSGPPKRICERRVRAVVGPCWANRKRGSVWLVSIGPLERLFEDGGEEEVSNREQRDRE